MEPIWSVGATLTTRLAPSDVYFPLVWGINPVVRSGLLLVKLEKLFMKFLHLSNIFGLCRIRLNLLI